MSAAGPGVPGSDDLARTVLDFEAELRRLVRAATKPGFTAADWAPLADYIAVDEFVRVGTWMETMDWQEYAGFLTQWAAASMGFDTTVRRVSEVAGLVYLEIEERHTRPAGVAVVNSLSVYEFNAAGKIRQLDVYLQAPRS